jgi:multiple sugar transport system substrate-binding protein
MIDDIFQVCPLKLSKKKEISKMRKISAITLMALLMVVLVGCSPAVTPMATADMSTNTPAPAVAATVAPTESLIRPDGLPVYKGGPAEIRMGWWGNDDRAARTQKVIDLFQAAYPEIKVKGEPNGATKDHFAIIDTQLAANNAPDLIQFGGN